MLISSSLGAVLSAIWLAPGSWLALSGVVVLPCAVVSTTGATERAQLRVRFTRQGPDLVHCRPAISQRVGGVASGARSKPCRGGTSGGAGSPDPDRGGRK